MISRPARLPGLELDPNGAARAGGFSLHAGLDIAASEREKLERLCRYVSRPTVAEDRLALAPTGHVRYTLKTPYRDGTTHIVLEPLDFIARLAALSFHRHRHPHDPDRDDKRNDGRARKMPPRYTIGLGASGAGMYWSGAMRCPKCRADMETLTIEGVEIDRCTACHGLWFDPGETEKLRDKKIAAAIDIGDAVTGGVLITSDSSRCPRCGGRMLRMTDARQKHIWYEECAACHGSYFDAGEFTDPATLSVSDLFKRFATPRRG